MKHSFLLLFIFAAGCQNFLPPENSSEPNNLREDHVSHKPIHHAPDQPEKFTHILTSDTPYYTSGPQQGGPPDGTLKKGTQIIVIQNSGSYSLVESADKIKAYIVDSSFDKIKN